jgi:hypothetical protein
MNDSRYHLLDETSVALMDALDSAQADISWAAIGVQVFEGIKSVYTGFSTLTDGPDQIWEMEDKVKELERYLVVDLECHVANKNGRQPFYLGRVLNHLNRANKLLETNFKDEGSGRQFVGAPTDVKDFVHLSAELQATFVEYGFCFSFEAVHDVQEITRRLDQINIKLERVEKSISSENDTTADAIADLHDAIAQQNGIQQAVTEHNLAKVKGIYDKLTDRILSLENNLCRNRLMKDSDVIVRYIECQKSLKNSSMSNLYTTDPSETINDYMIHPGTRGWLLERINRWFYHTDKKIFYLAGKSGSGKSSMAATVCKLHGSDVIASHFFSSSLGESKVNTVDGLLQSLAADMCKAVPIYHNYLKEKFNGVDIRSQLGLSWRQTYNILFRDPLNTLYGGKQHDNDRRRLIVIDAADECSQSEWADLKAILNAFMNDLPISICVFVTARTKFFGSVIPLDEDLVEGIRFEDRAMINRHIKDIEIYMSSCLGAILSGEDEVDTPNRAKADEYTLQNTADELLKSSAGRFDYATELMESFAKEMRKSSGQFLSSVKKAALPVRRAHQLEYENRTSDFASPFRAYRDKEGRSIVVRVMRQSQYPMDKSRAALIRGRHKIRELQK